MVVFFVDSIGIMVNVSEEEFEWVLKEQAPFVTELMKYSELACCQRYKMDHFLKMYILETKKIQPAILV